jgi:hypothetical protein
MSAIARVLLIVVLLAVLVSSCSPKPSPSPSPSPSPTTDTLAAAAQAYSAFTRSWSSQYSDALNRAAAAADADPANVAGYARELADAYQAYSDGVAQIEFPDTIRAAVDLEVQSLGALVGLARQLADDSSNIQLKTQLQEALGRVTERSAAVEAALDLSQ